MASVDWKEYKLKDLAKFINGRAFKPSEWELNGLPIIRIQNLTKSSIVVNYTNQQYEDKYLVAKGDLLLAWSATLDVFIWDGDNAWLNQHIFKVIENPHKVLKGFLYYTLKDTILEFYRLAHGSGIVHITKPILENHRARIPSLGEQQQIIAKLDEVLPWVSAIKLRLYYISSLQTKLLQSIADNDLEGKSVYKLGDYVSECTESIGSDWPSFTKIGVNKDDGIVELRTSKQTGFERYKIVRKGYLVYNPMRVNIGSIALYDRDEIAITSPDYVVFKTTNDVPPVVVFSFLKSQHGLMEINNNTQGAVRERLYFNQLSNINIGTALIDNAAKYGPVFDWFFKFNTIKPRIEHNLSKLEQSILSKAFQGELIEADSDFEITEKLVESVIQNTEQLC